MRCAVIVGGADGEGVAGLYFWVVGRVVIEEKVDHFVHFHVCWVYGEFLSVTGCDDYPCR
jgi:hypothetical protein